MTNRFDENGDLWIEVVATTLPQGILSTGIMTTSAPTFGSAGPAGSANYTAVTHINLTAYIRSLQAIPSGEYSPSEFNRKAREYMANP